MIAGIAGGQRCLIFLVCLQLNSGRSTLHGGVIVVEYRSDQNQKNDIHTPIRMHVHEAPSRVPFSSTTFYLSDSANIRGYYAAVAACEKGLESLNGSGKRGLILNASELMVHFPLRAALLSCLTCQQSHQVVLTAFSAGRCACNWRWISSLLALMPRVFG